MHILLFLINPILGMISAILSNLKKHYKEFVLINLLASLYFGFILTPKSDCLDSSRIIEMFNSWGLYYNSYLDFIKEYLRFQDIKDIFEGSVFSLVHCFSSNYHWIFVICALVFTAFKLLAFNSIYTSTSYSYNFKSILLTIVFFVSIPLFQINGFRFFTAAWIAIYTTIQIIAYHRRKMLFILALTPLVHITFIFYIIVFVFAYLISKHAKDELIIFLFFISILIGLVGDALPNIGEHTGIVGNLLNSYINQDYKNELMAATTASNYIRIFSPLRYLFYNFAAYLAYVILCGKYKRMSLWVIAMLTIVNFAYIIPDMSRFFYTLIPIIIFLMNLSSSDKRMTWMIYSLPIIELFHLYQIYFDLYPKVIPNGAMINIIYGLFILC